MKAEIYVSKFISNNPIDEQKIFSGLRVGVTKNGTINVHFQTRDKYVLVQDDGVQFSNDERALCFSLSPYLYDDNDNPLEEVNYEAYLDHPDYYRVNFELLVDSRWYTMVVTPLKHEYFVSFVLDDEVMNYDCLEAA